jgi:hypothetical protein
VANGGMLLVTIEIFGIVFSPKAVLVLEAGRPSYHLIPVGVMFISTAFVAFAHIIGWAKCCPHSGMLEQII